MVIWGPPCCCCCADVVNIPPKDSLLCTVSRDTLRGEEFGFLNGSVGSWEVVNNGDSLLIEIELIGWGGTDIFLVNSSAVKAEDFEEAIGLQDERHEPIIVDFHQSFLDFSLHRWHSSKFIFTNKMTAYLLSKRKLFKSFGDNPTKSIVKRSDTDCQKRSYLAIF